LIVAVVVTYQPDAEALDRLLRALRHQVAKVVVVDNGSSRGIDKILGQVLLSDPWCELVRLPENLGIAAALNIGIERARKAGADFVMLSDQDSEPASDMVERLLEVATTKAKMGVEVAAVGPRYNDERNENPAVFVKVRGLLFTRQACLDDDSVFEVDFLISSGSLIPLAALDAIGEMREDLFIDYVDIEWGLRAKRAGFQLFGVCCARMQHNIGDEPIHVFGRTIPCHSPLRHYYEFRNAARLYCEAGVAWNWKIAYGWRLLLKYVAYSLLAKPRHEHWWMMTLGIAHGLAGRMGRLDRR